jgi:SAM-dependent methyltransferase
MPKTEPFEEHAVQYENWFERNRFAYESELLAVKSLLPEEGEGVEIGVGSGRFAAPLGIRHGVEPSKEMREIARIRGIVAVEGVAEKLPYEDLSFDFALLVTTICFLDDVGKALEEARRVITHGGCVLIGFVDRESRLGRFYLDHRYESVFYKQAVFYSVDDVVGFLVNAGFSEFTFAQTIFKSLSAIKGIEPVKEGYGEGSFVVVKGRKRS